MQGVAVFKDRNDNVIMRKKNLVVLRGRIFTLQRLFCETDRTSTLMGYDIPTPNAASFFPGQTNAPNPTPWGTYVDTWAGGGTLTNNLNRMLCLFRIGNGAYNIDVNPWSLVNPPHSYDLRLHNARPFRIFDKSVPGWTNPIVANNLEHIYPVKNWGASADSILTSDADPNLANWTHKRITAANNAGEIQYLWKRFNCTTSDPTNVNNFKPEWACHYGQNSACVKMTLWLDEGDASGDKINELGLYIANISMSQAGKIEFKYPEEFTHLTFETEPMHGNKDIKVEYFLFA
jgi:hypothetical protein